jgi:hypothetical protein
VSERVVVRRERLGPLVHTHMQLAARIAGFAAKVLSMLS